MNISHSLKTNQFLRHNAVFFAGSLVAAIINYAFYPVLSRLLDVAHFGETQVLISLFLQLSVFFSVSTIVVTNIVNNDFGAGSRVVEAVGQLITSLTIASSIIMLLLSNLLKTFFHLNSVLPLYALVACMAVSSLLAIHVAYLRGVHHFATVTVSAIISAVSKLFFSTILVYLGLQTFGAIGGIALAQLTALAYSSWHSHNSGLKRFNASLFRLPKLNSIKPEIKYFVLVALVTIATTVQLSIDILVVNHYFDANSTGLYAGIATVARILYFLTASIAAVLLSSLKLNNAASKNWRLLTRSILILSAISLPALLVFSVKPSFVISVLMGVKYLALPSLLPMLSSAVFLIALVNILLTYALALRRYSVLVPVLAGSLVTYTLLLTRHESLDQIAQNIFFGSLVLLTLLAGWVLYDKHQIIPIENNN